MIVIHKIVVELVDLQLIAYTFLSAYFILYMYQCICQDYQCILLYTLVLLMYMFVYFCIL